MKTETLTTPEAIKQAKGLLNPGDRRLGEVVGLVTRDGLATGAAVRLKNGATVEVSAGVVKQLPRPAHRPKLNPGEARVRLNTTVRPATLEAITADKRPGESLGQVVDRWAEQARKGGQK